MINRVIKISGYVLLAIGIVILLLWILLKFPAVQNATADYAARSLTRALDAEVSIEEVRFKLFKEFSFHGLLIRDQKNDTLFSVRQAVIEVGHFDLWNRDLFFQDVAINGFKVRMDLSDQDRPSNYQFLLDYFSGDTSKQRQSAWVFGLAKLKLADGDFQYRNDVLGNYAQVDLGQLLFLPE